ncbi:hypothetical protein [Streptomyces sp. NPDC020951]|uniref:hypothetical protein n=1 Tax=Streptomyces sp. NPDC020951 TaxID=3365104 RepID=UPI0037A721EC
MSGELYAADQGAAADAAAAREVETRASLSSIESADAWAEPEEPYRGDSAESGDRGTEGASRRPPDAHDGLATDEPETAVDEIGFREPEPAAYGPDTGEPEEPSDDEADVSPGDGIEAPGGEFAWPEPPYVDVPDMEQEDSEDSGAGDVGHESDQVAAAEEADSTSPPDAGPGETVGGAQAPEDAAQSSDRGLLGHFRDAVAAVRGRDKPTEVQSLVDRPDFQNQYALNARPDRYGTPLEREDGTRVPLFDGAPRREQTHQGSIGDCGIISTMGAVAGHMPDTIRDCVREREDGSYDVTLHETKYVATRDRYESTGRSINLTVTPDLPVFSKSPGEAGFARTAEVGVAWSAILEKAIAGVDQTWDDERRAKWDRQHPQADSGTQGYVRLDDGSYGNERAELLTQITGRPSSTVDFPHGYDMQGRSADRQLIEDIRGKLADDCPVLVGTVSRGASESPLAKDLISGHAYEVTKVDDRGFFHLRNPHNRNHPEALTLSEFKEYINHRYVTLE